MAHRHNLCIKGIAWSKELLGLSRNSLRKIIGLLTGHCGLKRYLNIMGVAKVPMCRGCKYEEETALHILGDYCDMHTAFRFEHFGCSLIVHWELQDIPVMCLPNFISVSGLLKD